MNLIFKFLVHVLVIIALLTINLSDAFPYISQSSFDNDPSTIVVKSNFVRREEYDPYGFNSILSRFYKRSQFDDIDKNKRYSSDEINFD